MNYNKIFYTLMLGALSSYAWSMEELSENDLSISTGQDGISVQLDFANGTIGYTEIHYIDKDGFRHTDPNPPHAVKDPVAPVANYTHAGSLVMAPKVSGQAIRLLQANNTAALRGINVKVDADGNANNPILNIYTSLPDTKTIHIMPFSAYLSSGSGSVFSAPGVTTLRTGVTEILEVGSGANGAYINFNGSTPVAMNMQLGGQAQGYFAKFTGSIACISNSQDCSAPTAIPIKLKDASTSQNIQLGVMLQATDTQFRLDPFHLSISSDGLVIGSAGTIDKFNVQLSNVAIGSITSTPGLLPLQGPASTTLFNGVPNGALGTFGAIGVTTTDFKMSVKGI